MFLNVVSGGVLLGETLHNYSLDNEYKQNSINKGRPVYYDSKGRMFLTSTGEQVYNGANSTLKSVKTGRVVYDFKKESAKNVNRESIEEAKLEGKKYAILIYPEFNQKRYATELSTMRRFYLRDNGSWRSDKKFYKIYYKDGSGVIAKYGEPEDEKVEITKEEYDEFGGYCSSELYAIYYI